MIWVWLFVGFVTAKAQDFEPLKADCYPQALLLICSQYYTNYFESCHANSDIADLSFHRPTTSICVKKHLDLCTSGDFCSQATLEKPEPTEPKSATIKPEPAEPESSTIKPELAEPMSATIKLKPELERPQFNLESWNSIEDPQFKITSLEEDFNQVQQNNKSV